MLGLFIVLTSAALMLNARTRPDPAVIDRTAVRHLTFEVIGLITLGLLGFATFILYLIR